MSRGAIRAASAVAIRSDTKTLERILAFEAQLRGDIWNRWLALAQKRALIWWRDRSVAPGLNARFTAAGASFYGFGPRLRKPFSLKPYYHATGSLQRALMKRKPRTPQASKNGNIVKTLLKFGGLSLNLMDSTKPDMRQITGWTRTTKTVTESFNVGAYTRPWRRGSSTIVSVPAHTMTRQRTYSRHTATRGGETHAALFGKFTRDAPVIQARVAIEMRRIIRASAYDKRTGLIKSSVAADSMEAAA